MPIYGHATFESECEDRTKVDELFMKMREKGLEKIVETFIGNKVFSLTRVLKYKKHMTASTIVFIIFIIFNILKYSVCFVFKIFRFINL